MFWWKVNSKGHKSKGMSEWTQATQQHWKFCNAFFKHRGSFDTAHGYKDFCHVGCLELVWKHLHCAGVHMQEAKLVVGREIKIFLRLITFWHLHSNTSFPKHCVQTALLWLLLLIFSLTQQTHFEHMWWCKLCEEVEKLTMTARNQWGQLTCLRCARAGLQWAVTIFHAEAQRGWMCLWNYIIIQQWEKLTSRGHDYAGVEP